MQTHVKVVAWLHIFIGIAGLLMVLLAVVAAKHVFAASNIQVPHRLLARRIIAFPNFLLFVGLLTCVPSIVAGFGLLMLKSWSRTLGVVAAIVCILVYNPVHIALGVYTLIVLLNANTANLFGNRSFMRDA